MRKIAEIYDRFLNVTGVISGILIGFIALGIGADVTLRNLGFGGIKWMLESVEYGLFLVPMVGAAYVLKVGRHVRVDFVANALPERFRKPLDILTNALSSLICIVFFYYSLLATLNAYSDGSTIYKTFTLKEWMPLTFVALSLGLVSGECLRRLWVSIVRNPEQSTKTSSKRHVV